MKSFELVDLLNLVPNVEKLILYIDRYDEADKTFSVNLNRLKDLRICGYSAVNIMKLIKIKPGNVTKFSILSCDDDCPTVANEFIKNQLNLTSSDFTSSWKGNRFVIPDNFLSNCNLEELKWNVESVDDKEKFLNFIKSQKNVRKLRINMISITDDDFEQILTAMRELEVLDILKTVQLTDRGFKHIFKLSKLSELSLSFNEMPNDDMIHAILHTFKNKVMSNVERLFLFLEFISDDVIALANIQVNY